MTIEAKARPCTDFESCSLRTTPQQSLGDLNGDGYADIAVGAPFQDKTGVVYILFLGYGGVVASYTKICAYFGNPAFGNPTYKVGRVDRTDFDPRSRPHGASTCTPYNLNHSPP